MSQAMRDQVVQDSMLGNVKDEVAEVRLIVVLMRIGVVILNSMVLNNVMMGILQLKMDVVLLVR